MSFFVVFDDCEKLTRRNWAIKVYLRKFSEGKEKSTKAETKPCASEMPKCRYRATSMHFPIFVNKMPKKSAVTQLKRLHNLRELKAFLFCCLKSNILNGFFK